MLGWMGGFLLCPWLGFLVTELSYRLFFLLSALVQTFLWRPSGCGKKNMVSLYKLTLSSFSTYYIG